MRKVLRIIAVASGIVSAVAIAILGYIYLEELAQNAKNTFTKFAAKRYLYDDEE